jgi:energy-coupling factor transporter ATP-binding protein EcfA2
MEWIKPKSVGINTNKVTGRGLFNGYLTWMMMSEPIMICPYTGLRSFSEEESLYFKGRDIQIDQITNLLEQNRFLMVTGASGEGKSSLIYAGLIPNARSGFFKAKYTNWVVADFRPERSPVKNMAKSVAEKFDRQPATVETELRRGYSSLIDLYINSEFFIDEQDIQWQQLVEQEKNARKRKAANLLILVDQFEEFFTNPENFYNEAPSQDSQIVVNLILETARIAIKNKLPVYVVCTMRSDYIGQCSAFRGLPEYIGFSQFFVPRLKRKDLKQVVEEPAILSGNRISQRLIERLVFDLSEGVDQLPILQHTLSQIWLAADHGAEEMDLIHYARVGGMPANDLPDEDQAKFRKWFNQLPEHQKGYYNNTGLNKVIEIHASTLYENAWVYYNQKHPEKPITQPEAKRIIALVFCCLTKIDNSRAVRNRMTLGEITEIINSDAFTAEVVGDVLSIYREEGNSFIRPFKTEDPATHILASNTVLDITHESLIRNWNKLNDWASREFDFFTNYLDFKKQLDRWKNSGKSNDYLLPIGPLTFFENWYNQCKPNVGWIKRYSEIQEDENKARAEAQGVLADIQEFLKRSARSVMITRAFMKYGPQRIASIMAVVIMFILSGFYWFDAEQKSNSSVVEKVRAKASALLESKEVNSEDKALYLLMEERYEKGTLIPNLEKLDKESRLGIAIKIYRLILLMDKNSAYPFKQELVKYIQANLRADDATDYELRLIRFNEFVILLSYDNYYNPDTDTRNLLTEATEASHGQVLEIISNKKSVRTTFPIEINVALQWWLTFGKVTPEKLENLVNLTSPYHNEIGKLNFEKYYVKGREEPNGRTPNIYHGGFHTLASLYASLGNVDGVLWCFNQILSNGQKEYFGIGRQLNNYNNIVEYFYQNGHRQKVAPVIEWLNKNDQADRPVSVYRNLLIRAGTISRYFGNNIEKNYLRTYRGYFFPNLCLSEENVFRELAEDYVKEIQKLERADERNFLMAMHFKRTALHRHKYYFDRGLTVDQKEIDELLERSVQYFRTTGEDFLNEVVEITISYGSDGVRTRKLPRKHLLIYPDYMDGWFSSTYHSDLYFNFLAKNDLLTDFYKSTADLELIPFWLAKAHEFKPPSWSAVPYFDNFFPLGDSLFIKVIAFIQNHPLGDEIDLNYCHVIMANRALSRGDTINGLKYMRQINQDGIIRTANKYEYVEKTFFLNQIKELGGHLAAAGKPDIALQLAERFQQRHEKLFSYVWMAETSYQSKNPQFFIYLDSAMAKVDEIDFGTLPFEWDARYNLISLLAKIGGEKMNALAMEIFRDIPEGPKFFGTFRMADGLAAEGNFFKALSIIPSTLTEEQDLISSAVILWEACQKREKDIKTNEWSAMDFFISGGWNYPIYFRPF